MSNSKRVGSSKIELSKSKADGDDDLLSKLNSRSLVLKGRVSDGVITDIGGDWFNTMGYHKSDLVGPDYDEGFIHEEDAFKIKQNQANMLKSSGLRSHALALLEDGNIKIRKHILCSAWFGMLTLKTIRLR